jgi:hypothetical protein
MYGSFGSLLLELRYDKTNIKFITNTEVLPQNWFKIDQLLDVDDSIMTYTFFLATWIVFEVQSDSGEVKLDLSVAIWVPDSTEASLDLWAITLIIENIYSQFLKFASQGVTDVILHPTKEITLDLGFAQRCYDVSHV